MSSATALRGDDGAPPRAGYRTFESLDLNGDSVVDQWDEAAKQAALCRVYAGAIGKAATRYTNADWCINGLLLLVNALTALSGAGSALGSIGSGSTGLATMGLSAIAGALVGLQRALQPADKAGQCRRAQRALLTLDAHAETVAVFTQPADRPADGRKFVDDLLDEMARILEPPVVADAVSRFGPRD